MEVKTEIEVLTTPKRSPSTGFAFSPLSQLEKGQLRGPYYISGDEWKAANPASPAMMLLLAANPQRVMFSFQQIQGLVTYIIKPGSDPRISEGGSTYTSGPNRFHCAEWPGLCQTDWYAHASFSGDVAGTIFEVFEFIM